MDTQIKKLQDAINYSKKKLSEIGDNFEIIKSNFKNIKEELNKRGIYKVDGILFDLGVSSPQLDNTDRGFSYHNDARLDMRMDRSQYLTAYVVVNTYSLEELTRIFRDYGDERFAYQIAKSIVKARETKPVETTFELVDLIKKSKPMKELAKQGHPAKQAFQALRIAVNDEINVLEKALVKALKALKPHGGRLAVITFHSLEDRIIKQTFAELVKGCTCPPQLPVCVCGKKPQLKKAGNITPSKQEVEENPRSRSARLRFAIKR